MSAASRALHLAYYLDRVSDCWWAYPIRGRLERIRGTVLHIAIETARMQREMARTQRLLDEIAEDGREKAMLHEAAHLALTCDSPTALAELERVVEEFAIGRKKP